MPDIYSILILFAAGSAAGFINVMAGGGSSITLPVLIFLGLDSAAANGTNRVGVLFQNVSAVYAFKKENYQQFNTSIKLGLLTLPGAVAGAIIATTIGDELFQKILGGIIIAIIFTMIIPRKKVEYSDHKNLQITIPAYLSMFFIGFYGGFIQVGIGFLLMAALHSLLKLKLVYVNMHKVFIVLLNTVPALLVFIITNNVNWSLGLSLAAGNAFGGWWSAKISVKKGEGIIKVVLAAAMLIMALKLFGIF
ncbi:MAG: sulfite exporter TauE/SafE family protein [Ignavibacteriales bacterium]|nr:MAG: sulfite exporter TauE/SafE family protein [Ignavibacteriales bacterium]